MNCLTKPFSLFFHLLKEMGKFGVTYILSTFNITPLCNCILPLLEERVGVR